MELTKISFIKKLLKKHQARPLKRMGQNFLANKKILEKIILAAEIKKEDTIVEIGSGMGTLTQTLAEKAKKVIAIEKDLSMIKIMQKTLSNYKNIQLVRADILKYQIKSANFKVVANVPYYVASPIIRKFLEAENKPKLMVLMVQKEVALRICAKTPNMNLLAVSVQIYGMPKIISYVPKNNFWPIPKVDSAILKITPHKKPLINNFDLFFKIVKAGFSQPRKQLINNFSRNLEKNKRQITDWLHHNNLSPLQRAQTLSISNWIGLAQSYSQSL